LTENRRNSLFYARHHTAPRDGYYKLINATQYITPESNLVSCMHAVTHPRCNRSVDL